MPFAKFAPEFELPIVLDHDAPLPLYKQLMEQVRSAILNGRLPAGTRLPSTRALAQSLDVSRTVTASAYDELFAEGYIEGQQGSGTYVGKDIPVPPRGSFVKQSSVPRWLKQATLPQVSEPIKPDTIAFRLGIPSLAPLPPRIWREAWRSVTSNLPPSGYGPPAGDPLLQTALAAYLGRSRGLLCEPEDIIITSGAIQALDLIAHATLASGDLVGFEEPGYPVARQVLLDRGGRLLPLPVDDDGLQVDALPHGSQAPLLVYTTPSHQYPLATRLCVARRMALLKWAEINDSLIVEDDYDSEFRFDASPLPALAGLDATGRVAYIGTFSKVLTPALRIGYLVAPPLLRQHVERLKQVSDYHTSWPVQRMLARLIADGHLDRHIRRMRHVYAEKRRALESALAPIVHLAQVRGLEAGLHAYLELRPDLDATLIAKRTGERKVMVTTLETFYIGTPDRSGLLLGYGGLELCDILKGAHVLREVIEQCACT